MIKKICQLIKDHRYVAMNFLQHADQAQVIIVVRTKDGADVAPMNLLVAPEELECALNAALGKAIDKAMLDDAQAAKGKAKPLPPPMPPMPENDGGAPAAKDDQVEGWD